jgi:peptide deformylase
LLRIVTYPHPALRYESRPVTQIDERLRSDVRAMFDLMYEAKGIGLAANQVAIPLQFFVLNLSADREQPDQEQVFINPEIVKRHAAVEEEEGCLSFPGLYAKVKRARRVKIRAYDLQGNEVTIDAEELYGRALQHETDHLHGRLFVDLLDPSNKATAAAVTPKIREIEQAFRDAQARGEYPPDDEIRRQLDAWPEPPPAP